MISRRVRNLDRVFVCRWKASASNIFRDSRYTSFISQNRELVICKNSAGNIQMQYEKIPPLMTSAIWDKNKLKLKININENYFDEFESIEEKHLILKHKQYGKENEYQLFEDLDKDKGLFIMNAIIPITDEKMEFRLTLANGKCIFLCVE